MNPEPLKEFPYEEFSDQKEEENTIKQFLEDPILDKRLTSKIKTNHKEPNQGTVVHRSTRSKVHFKEEYVPSMTGNKYKKLMAELDKQRTLHLDAQIMSNLAVE